MSLTVMVLAGCLPLAGAQSLIRPTTAARHGLTRAWFAQVGSAWANGPLEHVNYDEGMLLVQTKRGLLVAIDGETGRTLWSTQVGPRDRSTSEPAANDKYVVVVNGSNLHVMNRADGSLAWQRQVSSALGAGPGITATHVFVPLISGRVEGYDLEAGAKQTPWNYQSSGHVLTPPLTTASTVSWTTARGYFYVADPAAEGIRYRLETRAEITARPAAWSPHLFACSTDGYVYALNEESGRLAWEFATGESIYEPPVAIEGRVYVVTEFSGMYCLNADDGTLLWHTAGVSQFVAVSPSRVYASDKFNNLAILDLASGARLGTMPLGRVSGELVNTHSDRIFLVDKANVIQCLHETALHTPVMHTPPPPAEKPKVQPRKRAAEPPTDFAEPPPADTPPAGLPPADAPPADEPPAGDPFGDLPPAGDAGETENPFNP